jgi:UDP-N-acetylglucosamine:LPS N-acetylglucosamine transferase
MLVQGSLTPEVLAQSVTELLREGGEREAMAVRAKARGRPHAASEIVSRLLTLLV